jgi:hypothetical protein
MDESDQTLKIFLKFIFELTIIQRDAISQNKNIDAKLFRLIHLASGHALAGKDWNSFLTILKSYIDADPASARFMEFAISRASGSETSVEKA